MSQPRQFWKQLCAAACLIVAAAGLAWFRDQFSTSISLTLWALLLALFVLLVRAGQIRLLGPLFAYDVVRTIRRSRIVLFRIIYMLFLFVLLLCLYTLFFYDIRYGARDLWTGISVRRDELTAFAVDFAYGFIILQLLTVLALTPAYVAGAIAEEKEHGTMQAMLVTDLRSHEIVLGMFLSRLGSLLLIVLGGLPILASLQFLGGIDPNIILAMYATTGLSMVGLAGVAMVCSVYAQGTRQAIIQTYLAVLAYLALSLLTQLLLLPGLGLAKFPSRGAWVSPITVESSVKAINAGNIVSAIWECVAELRKGKSIEVLLANAVSHYAWFHGLLVLSCVAWATLRLRSLALRERSLSKRRGWLGGSGELAIGNHAMLWKTLVAEARSRRSLLGLLLTGLLIAGLAWPGVQVVYYFGRLPSVASDDHVANLLNLWIRGLCSALGCLMLLGVAVRASGSISGERERQTLDGLLATPLTNRAILFSKWLGSILNERRWWFWLALVFGVGVASESLHPLAIPYFVLAWFVYAALLGGLGLWFSVAARNSRRALMGTLTSCLLGMVFFLLAAYDLAGGWLTPSDAYSLLPPETLGFLAFSPADYKDWAGHHLTVRVVIYPLALGCCACAAAVLWVVTQIRFRHVTGRELHGDGKLSLPADAEATWFPVRRVLAAFSLLPWRGLPRALLRLCIISIPLILLLGWYARLASVKEIALQQAFAEMESLEAAWRTKTPARQADTPPEILHLLDTPFPSVFFDTELERPRFYEPSNVLLTGEVIAAMREGLRPCQSGLKVVRRLADMPHAKLAVPDDYVTVFVQGTLGANVNNLATILSADIQLRAHDQDPDGALASCRARINLARALRQGSGIAGFRDGTDIAASTLPLIEQSLGLGEPSEAALVALQQLLAEEYPQLALFQRLRISWRFMDSILNESKTNTRGFLTDLRRVPKIPVRVPSAERLSMLVENSIADDRLENLRRYRELMQAALLPSDERNAQFMAIDAAWQADPRTNRLLEDPRRLVLSQEKWEGELCSTIVALVVERYRLQNGSWPELLSVLVPKFLPAVPLDPIDGKPLRYRRLVDGVVIYSVGSDGIDNGGNIELAGPLMRAGTDAGFRLWDPAKRRQPARLMRTQLPGMAQPPPPTNSRQPRRNLMGGIVVPTKKK